MFCITIVNNRYIDYILKNIHFKVKSGEKIVLVGPPGSGKTTIINLLMRFYDVTEWELRVDGRDIRDYQIHLLRKKIDVVLQDTYLISGTIMENIRYGRLEATDEEARLGKPKPEYVIHSEHSLYEIKAVKKAEK